MSTVSGLVAMASLFLTIALLLTVGGALFAVFTFGLFLLALVGVMTGLENRTVRQHDADPSGTRWRDGS